MEISRWYVRRFALPRRGAPTWCSRPNSPSRGIHPRICCCGPRLLQRPGMRWRRSRPRSPRAWQSSASSTTQRTVATPPRSLPMAVSRRCTTSAFCRITGYLTRRGTSAPAMAQSFSTSRVPVWASSSARTSGIPHPSPRSSPARVSTSSPASHRHRSIRPRAMRANACCRREPVTARRRSRIATRWAGRTSWCLTGARW